MENKALGKGLSALIPEKINLENPETISSLKTVQILENSLQPRTDFNSERLSDLITSIKEKGVLQPIIVRKKDNNYEVIAGERRLRAARALGLDDVPVIIKSVNDQEALVIALVENIQREELNAIEEAKAFKRLIEEFNFTQDFVAQSVARDRSTVGNILRLLKLPEEIQKSLSQGDISMGHARALLGVEETSQQKKLFERTVKKGLSVRELENLVRPSLRQGGRRKRSETVANREPYLLVREEELQKILGTKVRITTQKKRGKITIEYYSPDDLERIIDAIKH